MFGPLVDGDDGSAAEADVVLQRNLDVIDLALLGHPSQLPVQLRALRKAGRAERMALRDQTTGGVDDRAGATIRGRLPSTSVWPSPSGASPSAS